MTTHLSKSTESLTKTIDEQPSELRDLFAKVINLCAESQDGLLSDAQLRDRIRKELESSVARKRIL